MKKMTGKTKPVASKQEKQPVCAGELLTAGQRERAARVLHALAHPTRLAILQALTSGELTCSQLLKCVGGSQSMLSMQVSLLTEQGLLTVRKAGTLKYCSLRNPDFLNLFACMRRHLSEILPPAPGTLRDAS